MAGGLTRGQERALVAVFSIMAGAVVLAIAFVFANYSMSYLIFFVCLLVAVPVFFRIRGAFEAARKRQAELDGKVFERPLQGLGAVSPMTQRLWDSALWQGKRRSEHRPGSDGHRWPHPAPTTSKQDPHPSPKSRNQPGRTADDDPEQSS